MNIAMIVGITLHSSSSGRLPSMRAPIWPVVRAVVLDAEHHDRDRHADRKQRARREE
jgi:hypothetical protein